MQQPQLTTTTMAYCGTPVSTPSGSRTVHQTTMPTPQRSTTSGSVVYTPLKPHVGGLVLEGDNIFEAWTGGSNLFPPFGPMFMH